MAKNLRRKQRQLRLKGILPPRRLSQTQRLLFTGAESRANAIIQGLEENPALALENVETAKKAKAFLASFQAKTASSAMARDLIISSSSLYRKIIIEKNKRRHKTI